jgi:hypothetical protein
MTSKDLKSGETVSISVLKTILMTQCWPNWSNDLKGLGHEIRIVLKWYGLISLSEERVRQIFIIF